MREFDQAVGQIVGCCATMGATYRGGKQQGNHVIEIHHRGGGIFTVVGNPTNGYFTASSVRRLTNVNKFDITQSEPIVQIDTEISDIVDDLEMSNIMIEPLTKLVESESLEYFDGYRTRRPLFVYDEGFDPRQFDKSVSELDQVCRIIFNKTLDIVGIALDEIDETAGSETDEVPDDIAFH